MFWLPSQYMGMHILLVHCDTDCWVATARYVLETCVETKNDKETMLTQTSGQCSAQGMYLLNPMPLPVIYPDNKGFKWALCLSMVYKYHIHLKLLSFGLRNANFHHKLNWTFLKQGRDACSLFWIQNVKYVIFYVFIFRTSLVICTWNQCRRLSCLMECKFYILHLNLYAMKFSVCFVLSQNCKVYALVTVLLKFFILQGSFWKTLIKLCNVTWEMNDTGVYQGNRS